MSELSPQKHYQYRAYDRKGHLVSGVERGSSENQISSRLRQQGLIPLDLTPLSAKKRKSRIGSAQIEELTSQLALLLKSGLRIDKALDVLAENATNGALQSVLEAVQQEVQEGKELSFALSAHPKVFPALYVEMVKVGESSGRLPAVFLKLAENLKFQRELSSKIVQAMVYPSFILLICLLSLVAIFNFVVPSLSGLFDSLTEIPTYTRFLMSTSEWMQNYQFHLLAVVVVIAVGASVLGRKEWFRAWVNGLFIRFPVTRAAVLQVERIRYSAAMELMLTSGVDLSTAMQMSSGMVKSPSLGSQLQKAHQNVSQGGLLLNALKGLPLFDSISLSLLNVGEETGQLGEVFGEVNRRARDGFESWILRLTTLLEPLMIVFMGGIVGSVVVIMLLSIVSVNDVSF